jgi:hypothetical protein
MGPATAHAGSLLDSLDSCPAVDTSPAFAQFLDPLPYSLLPDGGFEAGATGWSLSGASVASGNETFGLAGDGGSHSLSLASGATATSPVICTSALHPVIRFTARGPGSLLSALTVRVLYEDAGGTVHNALVGAVPGVTRSWAPSLPMPVLVNLTSLLSNGQTPVAFRFTATGGSFQIDDVFVDPYQK